MNEPLNALVGRNHHVPLLFARELASPTDALRVALTMLARRERLEIGDVLKVLPPSRTAQRLASET